MLRLLSYNIRHGGAGREAAIGEVDRRASPDLVVFQEATQPRIVERLARATRHGAVGRAAGAVARLHEPAARHPRGMAQAACLASRVH